MTTGDDPRPRSVTRSRRFLLEYGLLDDSRRAEFTLAAVRFMLAGVSLVAIYLEPTEPRLYAPFIFRLLAAYVVYSLALLAVLRFREQLSEPTGLAIHAGDVLVAFVMTLFTEGPTSPFFVFFGFVLIGAGFRWGLWGTIWTGAVSALLLGGEAVLVNSSRWAGTLTDGKFELNRFIIRCTYVILLAVIAEKEKTTRETFAILASAAERARVARELHDGVIQSLLGLRAQIEVLRRRESAGAAAAAELARIEALLDDELVNLRTLMFSRTTIDDERHDLSSILFDLIEQFKHASGISAQFMSEPHDGAASPRACHEIWRIVQEALVNVQKHSGAHHVLVRLDRHEDHWLLVIDDDGKGFDFTGRLSQEALDRSQRGPRVIKERVRILGGSLVVDSTPGVGARLEITVPATA